jgi:SEC-C motif-containing protein
MRSRYSAYAKGLEAYLSRTWAEERRPAELRLDPSMTWTGLDVREVHDGSPEDGFGTVEFVASYEVGGRPGTLHEISWFRREGPDDAWHYVGEEGTGTTADRMDGPTRGR